MRVRSARREVRQEEGRGERTENTTPCPLPSLARSDDLDRRR
jgi:hypothetical protein